MNTLNNGGATDYYSLPLFIPKKLDLEQLIDLAVEGDLTSISVAEAVQKLVEENSINTLNDLIEYKNMPFWRGEIFKACYGLEGRMAKNKDSSQAEIRELNKIIYYANRRLNMISRENSHG